jgi:uncharacterized OsmC-like protein
MPRNVGQNNMVPPFRQYSGSALRGAPAEPPTLQPRNTKQKSGHSYLSLPDFDTAHPFFHEIGLTPLLPGATIADTAIQNGKSRGDMPIGLHLLASGSIPYSRHNHEHHMADEQVVYRSRVHIERVNGPLRRAYLPAEVAPVLFGVHDEIAEYFGVDMARHEAHAATLDYLVAATGACLLATFGGALEARGIAASEGLLAADVVGEVVTEEKILVVRQIHVTYRLKLTPEQRARAQRVHRFHARYSPLARTIGASVKISTSLIIDELPLVI